MKGIKNLEINEEELDVVRLREIVKNDSSYKNIFSSIWQMSEELEKKGKNLQDFVKWMRKMQHNQIGNMYAEWERAAGKPMTVEQEKMAFQNSKMQVSLALIEKMIEYVDHLDKANEIAKLFGLYTFSPIATNKKGRGWSKGGKANAEQKKVQLEEKQARWLRLHQEMKKRNPGMSNHAVDLRIAKQEGVKRSTIYNARRSRMSK